MKQVVLGLQMVVGALLLSGCNDESGELDTRAESDVASEDAALTAASCTWYKMGGDTSCKPSSLWATYASQECARKGQRVNSFYVSVPCTGGNYRYASYECCPPK